MIDEAVGRVMLPAPDEVSGFISHAQVAELADAPG